MTMHDLTGRNAVRTSADCEVVMDAGKCQAFAAAVARVEEQHHLGLERSDCDDKRAELQKEFTKACADGARVCGSYRVDFHRVSKSVFLTHVVSKSIFFNTT